MDTVSGLRTTVSIPKKVKVAASFSSEGFVKSLHGKSL